MPRRRWSGGRRGTAIPTAVQEQNAYPGLATRLLSRRVRHVYLGLPEARSLLRFGPGHQVFDTGNPIAPPTPERRAAALARFGLDGTPAGGAGDRRQPGRARASTGRSPAGSMRAGRQAWICSGSRAVAPTRSSPGATGRPAVQVIDFLDPMADGYAVADLVVSRAGMITVAELCAWGLPSVLVPLPTAAADHQTHNARVLAEAGASAHAAAGGAHAGAAGRGGGRPAHRSRPPRRHGRAGAAPGAGLDAADEIVSKLLTLLS